MKQKFVPQILTKYDTLSLLSPKLNTHHSLLPIKTVTTGTRCLKRLKKLFSLTTQCTLQKVARYSHLTCSKLSTSNGHGLQIRDEKSIVFSTQFPNRKYHYTRFSAYTWSHVLGHEFNITYIISDAIRPWKCK
jgi:hypothetical protein